jgi:hypothetical protein
MPDPVRPVERDEAAAVRPVLSCVRDEAIEQPVDDGFRITLSAPNHGPPFIGTFSFEKFCSN